MKRLLALLLAMVCVLSFASCGDEKGKKKDRDKEETKQEQKNKDENSEEDLAKEAVEGFMDALISRDGKALMKYSNAEDEIGKDEAVDGLVLYLPSELLEYEDEFRSALEDLYDASSKFIKDNSKYKIKKMEKEDGDYVATVEVTKPISSPDDDFKDSAIYEEIALAMIEEGLVDEDSTEEEALEAMCEVIRAYAGEFETETETKTITMTVMEEDDKWIVDIYSLED